MTFEQGRAAVLLQLRPPGRHRAQARLLAPARPPRTRTPGPTRSPVGTGPFKVDPCIAEQHPVHRQPGLLAAGKPYIQKVEYPAYLDNGPANLDLASGKAQWGSQFIPNIKAFYLDKSADNHTWSPPVHQRRASYPNLDPSHAATSKLEVRQAISAAIDRRQVAHDRRGRPAAGRQPDRHRHADVPEVLRPGGASTTAGYDKPDPAKAKKLLAGARLLRRPTRSS